MIYFLILITSSSTSPQSRGKGKKQKQKGSDQNGKNIDHEKHSNSYFYMCLQNCIMVVFWFFYFMRTQMYQKRKTRGQV